MRSRQAPCYHISVPRRSCLSKAASLGPGISARSQEGPSNRQIALFRTRWDRELLLDLATLKGSIHCRLSPFIHLQSPAMLHTNQHLNDAVPVHFCWLVTSRQDLFAPSSPSVAHSRPSNRGHLLNVSIARASRTPAAHRIFLETKIRVRMVTATPTRPSGTMGGISSMN